MPNISLRSRIAFLVLIAIGSTSAWAVDPALIAQQGTPQVTACATCHGRDGGGQASFPRLAGMDSAYLLKQLQDYAEGRRNNAVMQPIAKALSTADRAAMSRYYAALPIPPRLLANRAAKAASSPGARLATRGDWSKGVPACVQCHGPGGIGVGANFPAIASQPADYISTQLRAWKAGIRTNDPLGLMGHLSGRLSEDQITAVSQWFATQPAVPGSRATTTIGTANAVPEVPAVMSPPVEPALVGRAKRGRQLAYTCGGCHGIAGYKNAHPNFHVPRIGGQSTQYVVNALSGYRSGTRKHPTMQAQAQGLSQQDIADIAAFLTTLK